MFFDREGTGIDGAAKQSDVGHEPGPQTAHRESKQLRYKLVDRFSTGRRVQVLEELTEVTSKEGYRK